MNQEKSQKREKNFSGLWHRIIRKCWNKQCSLSLIKTIRSLIKDKKIIPSTGKKNLPVDVT